MSSLFSRNNVHHLHLLTEMWIALRSEVNTLGMILGSEILAGYTYGFGTYTSEGKNDNSCNVKPDPNQSNFGRVIPSWISLDLTERTPRSNWDGLTPDLI
jgi:hypothetical protein